MHNDERQQKENRIAILTSILSSTASEIGDWKIVKYQEYLLADIEPPYDIMELHQRRQAIRDEINQLREEIAEMEVVS